MKQRAKIVSPLYGNRCDLSIYEPQRAHELAISVSFSSGNMARRDVTQVSERLRFVWLWVGGKSLRAIARETGVGATTVSRWIRRWLHEGPVHLRRHIRKEPHVNTRLAAASYLVRQYRHPSMDAQYHFPHYPHLTSYTDADRMSICNLRLH